MKCQILFCGKNINLFSAEFAMSVVKVMMVCHMPILDHTACMLLANI